MKVTFLAHSGFFVELESVCLLFDWWKGELPALPDKPLAVFASHRHMDHFRPEIFSLDDGQREVRFLLGDDIRLTAKNQEKWGVTPDILAHCTVLCGGEQARPFPDISVQALPSTDQGVAFLVTAQGQTIFHAGDLNWWHWPEEDPAWNREMEANFKSYTQVLAKRHIDLAMLPLDPRQGEAGFWGMAYYLELAEIVRALPMHQWDDFAFTQKFLAAHPEFSRQLVPLSHSPEEFFFPE